MSDAKRWYLLEVTPEFRSGRGRFWRPGGRGYTNDPSCAGVYEHDHPDVAWARKMSEPDYEYDIRYLAVPVDEFLAELEATVARFRLLVEPCVAERAA